MYFDQKYLYNRILDVFLTKNTYKIALWDVLINEIFINRILGCVFYKIPIKSHFGMYFGLGPHGIPWGGPMGSHGGVHGIPGWALGDPLALGDALGLADPLALGDPWALGTLGLGDPWALGARALGPVYYIYGSTLVL